MAAQTSVPLGLKTRTLGRSSPAVTPIRTKYTSLAVPVRVKVVASAPVLITFGWVAPTSNAVAPTGPVSRWRYRL